MNGVERPIRHDNDLVVDVLEADVRRQPDAVLAVDVGRRGMDHERAVQHDVTGHVVGDSPGGPVVFALHVP